MLSEKKSIDCDKSDLKEESLKINKMQYFNSSSNTHINSSSSEDTT